MTMQSPAGTTHAGSRKNGKLRVAVLMGGNSSERDVSLSTGRQILQALDRGLYHVHAIDSAFDKDRLPSVIEVLSDPLPSMDHSGSVYKLSELTRVKPEYKPDVVFIALHGPGGEDGTVQGMLDILGIPYTGSGVLASALAMDKALCKTVLTSVGVKMPRSVTIKKGPRQITPSGIIDAVGLPAIIKPSRQGSTFGVTILNDINNLDQALDFAFRYDDTALVEEFITGTEITVPIIGNDELTVMPIVEIVPSSGFYDYEAKYTPGATDEIVPARISPALTEQARAIARICHQTLGCRGMSRTDMIVTASGDIHTLEVNTIPGMTPTSLLPKSAEAAGLSFPELLNKLIALALEGR